MMDAGVIATARAAEIYSLNILAERIQVVNYFPCHILYVLINLDKFGD